MVASLADAQIATAWKYKVTNMAVADLNTLGGADSSARDINNLGDVVGSAQTADGKEHAFVHLDGTLYDIHGPDSPAFTHAVAESINDGRVVVGTYHDANYSGAQTARPFYYYPGIWLSSMPTDASVGMGYLWAAKAHAINGYDYIAGEAINTVDAPQVTQGVCHMHLPVWWYGAGHNPAGLFCIPDPDGLGFQPGDGILPAVHDINNSNNMVGTDGGKTWTSMFLWRNQTQQVAVVPPPAGTPMQGLYGYRIFGIARGLNENNWVVGGWGFRWTGSTLDRHYAFVWDGTSSQSVHLGNLRGDNSSSADAYDINEQNMVVGWSERSWSVGGQNHRRRLAYIWHNNFGMVQLPSIGGQFKPGYPFPTWIPNACEAYALNDRNSASGVVQVVGECTLDSGVRHAVRWDVTVVFAP